jgi:hypothetical protein
MQTSEFNKTITSAQLNESMFKKFGTRINFNKYTREQLEDYRNLLRTKISQVEASSNFNDLLTNETYQKDKYVMNVITTKIKEMLGESKLAERKLTAAEKKKKEEIVKAIKRDNPEKRSGKGKSSAYAIATAQAKKTAEGTEMKTVESKKAKPDFLDMDKDGNKKEPMKKAVADKKVKEAEEKRAPAKKSERTATLPSGAKVKATKVQGWQSQRADKEAKKDSGLGEASKKAKKDYDGDGKIETNKDEVWGSRAKAAAKAGKPFKESKVIFRRHVAIVNESLRALLREDEEGKAKAITAASDMVNDFTTWMQRVGQYQTKSMIELADAIRAEFGPQESEAFKQAVAPALASTIETLTSQREAISHAVAVLAGEATDMEPMGQETGMEPDIGGEEIPPAGDDDMNMGDEFGASDAAAGGAETAGREIRESRDRARQRRLHEQHSLMRTLSK